jgi:hypothetical protein
MKITVMDPELMTLMSNRMNDLCKEFKPIKDRDLKTLTIYMIPEATKKFIESDLEKQGLATDTDNAKETYREILADGLSDLVTDKRTSECISAWIDCKKSPSEFTLDEVNAIHELFYQKDTNLGILITAIDIVSYEATKPFLHN